jgi:allantoinase
MRKQDGVWITRRIEIARHWHATHPYPGHGLNEVHAAKPAPARKGR